MSVDSATLDDLATAVAWARVMAVRLEALASILVEEDPMVRALWVDNLDEMRKRVVRDGNALYYAHLREGGQLPPAYLSTQPARRCRFPVPGADGRECGKPSGWRAVDVKTAAARYACEDHESELRAGAAAEPTRVERLPI
jgi:hypothetical protein